MAKLLGLLGGYVEGNTGYEGAAGGGSDGSARRCCLCLVKYLGLD